MGTTLNECIQAMLKDNNVPINDIGTIILKPSEQKYKRFKYRNEKGRDLKLEVFSSVPDVIEIETPSIDLPFKQVMKEGSSPRSGAFIKFCINTPSNLCKTDHFIAIFEKDDTKKLIPLELCQFKLQNYEN